MMSVVVMGRRMKSCEFTIYDASLLPDPLLQLYRNSKVTNAALEKHL
jgi:hypothetical protein